MNRIRRSPHGSAEHKPVALAFRTPVYCSYHATDLATAAVADAVSRRRFDQSSTAGGCPQRTASAPPAPTLSDSLETTRYAYEYNSILACLPRYTGEIHSHLNDACARAPEISRELNLTSPKLEQHLLLNSPLLLCPGGLYRSWPSFHKNAYIFLIFKSNLTPTLTPTAWETSREKNVLGSWCGLSTILSKPGQVVNTTRAVCSYHFVEPGSSRKHY